MADNPEDTDEQLLGQYADAFAKGLAEHLEDWARREVDRRQGPGGDDVEVEACRRHLFDIEVPRIVADLDRLLATDIDQQRSSPLAVVRRLVPSMTALIRATGAVPPPRDADAVRLHPDDEFDIGPANVGQIHDDLRLHGLTWGAAKAHVHLARRRAEGLR